MKALKFLIAAALVLALCLGLMPGASAEGGEKIPYGELEWDELMERLLAAYNIKREFIAAGYLNLETGEEHYITMRFSCELTDSVFDKFGSSDTVLVPDGTDHFIVKKKIAVSPQFFAWVFGLGNYVTITAPDNVVKQMKDMLDKVSKRYE